MPSFILFVNFIYMHTVKRSVLVPYSAEQMFKLVADVDKYEEFMPWCGGSEVKERFENGLIGSVTIALSKIRHTFTTRNTHDFPNLIHLDLVDGPFSSLTGDWVFTPLAEDACKVEFTLNYAFNSRPLEFILGPIFNKVANSFIDSFSKRAEQQYGEAS